MHLLQVCLLILAATFALAKDGQDDGSHHGHGNDDDPRYDVRYSATTIYSSTTPIATISVPVFEDNPSRTNDDHPHTGPVTKTFEDNPARTNDDHPHGATPPATKVPSSEDNPFRTNDDHPYMTIAPGLPLPVGTPSPLEDNTKPGSNNNTTITKIEDNSSSSTDDSNSAGSVTTAAVSPSDVTSALVNSSGLSTSIVSSNSTGTPADSTGSPTIVPDNAVGSVDGSRMSLAMGILAAVAWIL